VGTANDIRMELPDLELAKRAMRELPKRVIEKGLKSAVTLGSTPIVRAARRNVPQESGLLKKSITKKVKLYRASETAAAIVGADTKDVGEYRGNLRKPSKYIAIVEGGARPHVYKTRKGQHPGFEGKHFLRQAEESEKDRALTIAQNRLIEVIENEAEKLR